MDEETRCEELEARLKAANRRISELVSQLAECPQIIKVTRRNGALSNDFPSANQVIEACNSGDCDIEISYRDMTVAGVLTRMVFNRSIR